MQKLIIQITLIILTVIFLIFTIGFMFVGMYFLYATIFTNPGTAAILTALSILILCCLLITIIMLLRPRHKPKKSLNNSLNFSEFVKHHPEESVMAAVIAGFLFTKYKNFRGSVLNAISLYVTEQFQTTESQEMMIDVLAKTINNLFNNKN